MIENLFMHIYVYLSDQLKPYCVLGFKTGTVKGKENIKMCQDFLLQWGTQKKLHPLWMKLRDVTQFGKISFSVYKHWAFSIWPVGV